MYVKDNQSQGSARSPPVAKYRKGASSRRATLKFSTRSRCEMSSSSSSGIAVSRIDAAANIQVFLIKQKYFALQQLDSSAQNDAVVKDVLRLAEYIGNQCKLLQAINEESKTIKFTLTNKSSSLSAGYDTTYDEKKYAYEEGATKRIPAAPKTGTSFADALNSSHESDKEEILSTPIKSSGKDPDNNHVAPASFASPFKSSEDSPGFDRLLNKMFSPSKSISNTAMLPSSLENFPFNSQRPQSLSRFEFLHESEADGVKTKLLQSFSAPSGDQSEDITQMEDTAERDSDPTCGGVNELHNAQSSSPEADGGTDTNDISTVLKSENHYYDDDDDDVFDLLQSVDDWQALKNFVRDGKPGGPTSNRGSMATIQTHNRSVDEDEQDSVVLRESLDMGKIVADNGSDGSDGSEEEVQDMYISVTDDDDVPGIDPAVRPCLSTQHDQLTEYLEKEASM